MRQWFTSSAKTSRYSYTAAGERIMKSYGTMEGVYINGAPQGITFHKTDNSTLYPASILSVNKNRFTKHYFIGDKRIVSRIGIGLFNNVYGRNGSYVTAGQQDYVERMNQIQRQKEAYYKQQAIAPGVPTMKGAYGDLENTKRGYNSIIDTLGNHDIPQGWIQTPHPNTTPGTNPGPPVSWNDPSNPDDPQAGYSYIPNDTVIEETFFYHSDHLSSTSYITDDHANITQYDAYLSYGELLVDEHSSSEDLPYKFNGKQFDEETGLYYYGARYLNPMVSIWYGVDPYNNMFPFQTSFSYCNANPILFIDPMELFPTRKEAKHYKIEHNINGRIQRNKDGQFDINDYNNHVSYTAGNDNFGPSSDTHPNDGVIESVLVTNKKEIYGRKDAYDLFSTGLAYLENVGYNKIPTSTKSKYVYELNKILKVNYGIKLGKNSHIYRNVIPKGLKVGTGLGVLSEALVVVDVVQNRSLKAFNVLDASIGAISFVPGWGWLVGVAYFGADMITKGITGKSIGDHVDQFVEEKFNADAGSIVNW